MTVHLIKLSVGTDSFADLQYWQDAHLRAMKKAGQKPKLVHVTRNTHKRAQE